ncbi:class I poly(R)-hydroxyalkanoic acid synthase [Litorivicinus lipolyticus]|uniref:Class I poly(R)-hydroxyalkanoic acid synthase n=1 Tax=Litorivicinus lipolyticus TaxID=418701 RepID=A0A5Q2QAV9_9GAMM|nr:class I poly(R)-hydroxyalkanoic acid synthase [Litorivicinus lipolyticus]QGG80393.1 class I poly(R)-hydroxyalkanoic acid synthase [Litorivicinus lipolyticus]
MNAPSNDPNQLFKELTEQTEQMMARLSHPDHLASIEKLTEAWTQLASTQWHDPTQWVENLTQFQRQQMNLWQQMMGLPTETQDRRFKSEHWEDQPVYDFIAQSYLLVSDMMSQWAEAAPVEDKDKEKLQFYTQAYIDAMSPSNFAATNPEVLKEAMESGGQSLLNGWKNLLGDVEKGRITMTDEAAFQVGENLAITPGQVVFKNHLFELIQYTPSTPEVNAKPMLIVPPCINKFYILDLGKGNSFIEYSVAQGNTVFVVSWVNPDASYADTSWSDYVDQGVIKATKIVREIADSKKINAVSWCVGGTLLACAMAVMQSRRDNGIDSATFLTTLLDFSDPGQLGLFLEPDEVDRREAAFRKEGYFSGKSLALGFNLLRSNDLIWSYVVNNYLKGKTPPPFDILYWNSDPTNLPAEMYAFYIRELYLNNKLKDGQLEVCGKSIDLSKVKVPCYFLSALEDHIAPWKATFEGTQLLGGKATFVLGGSGHIAGVINPPHKNKRNYWSDGELGQSADHWLDTAQSHPGSWWTHWSAWVKAQGDSQVAAPETLGSDTYPALYPAPGEYVKVRI